MQVASRLLEPCASPDFAAVLHSTECFAVYFNIFSGARLQLRLLGRRRQSGRRVKA